MGGLQGLLLLLCEFMGQELVEFGGEFFVGEVSSSVQQFYWVNQGLLRV